MNFDKALQQGSSKLGLDSEFIWKKKQIQCLQTLYLSEKRFTCSTANRLW